MLNSVQLQHDLAEQLLCLQGSTTLFVESLAKKELQVHVISQQEDWFNSSLLIKRVVKLYFEKPELPVFYCLSYIEKNSLSEHEYTLLIGGGLPIGKIFSSGKEKQAVICKKNISAVKIFDSNIAAALNIDNELIYGKKFQFFAGNRYIGVIEEYFTDDTLQRL